MGTDKSKASSGVRTTGAPGAKAVRQQLVQVLGSADLDATRRSRQFLAFIVEEALAGRGEALTQGTIATRVFDRKDDFDPVVDPIVRIQAGRLRRSLERYYLLSGRSDPVRIELPKGSYVPVFRSSKTASEPAIPRGRRAGEGPATDGWPALVVGEFEPAHPDPDLQESAAQMSEEMALELGRYRAVRVLRRRDWDALDPGSRGHQRFMLDGRVRGTRGDLRVSARLLDRTSGQQVWADEYDGGLGKRSSEDVARVIAARVGAEEGVVVQLLAAERRGRAASEPTPYDAFLRSYDFFLARDPEAFGPAVEALRKVVVSNPECGLAWTRLARLYMANHVFEATEMPTPLEDAVACAQCAVRVDPSDRSARCILASALLYKGELAAAQEQLDAALASSPESLAYLEIIAYLMILTGRSEQGEALSRSALERNPHCLPHVLFGLWTRHVARGEIDLAYRTALEYRDPTFFLRSVMRASCLGLLGRMAEAKVEIGELLSMKADFDRRGRVLLSYHIKFPEVMDPVVDGLAKAGLVLD
jgi:adenylate cyclase